MVKVFMKDGTVKEIKGAKYAEILPERIFVPELVVKESSYGNPIATFNYGDILGYEVAEDKES